MKSIFAFALCLTASSAFACPVLQGDWSCTSSDGSTSEAIIQQHAVPGGALYQMKDASGQTQEIYADGAVRPVTQGSLSGTAQFTCVGSTGIKGREVLASRDHALGVDAKISVGLVSRKTFMLNLNAVVQQKGSPAQTTTSSMTCQRK